MRANERFEGAIADAISNSAVLLIVFSPSWKNSPYCAEELDWFNRCAGPTGAAAGRYSRIVAVQRGQVPRDQWPAEIRGQHESVSFCDPVQPIIPLAVTDSAFLRQLGSVVAGLSAVLFEMKSQREAHTSADEIHNAPAPIFSNDVPTLYLGATSALAAERTALVRDLEQVCRETGAQIRVLPEDPLPDDPDAARAAIAAALERSCLSLHLLGGAPDDKPPGWQRSPCQLALEVALTLPLPYRPLVWLPKTVDIGDVDSKSHTRLLEALRDTGRPPEFAAAGAAEFFHADIEELKSTLHHRIVPPSNPVRTSLRKRSKRRQLIYVCHRGSSTAAAIAQIEGCFDTAFYEVWSLDHNSANSPARHHATLENCDGFAVVYDTASLDWADGIVHDALICSRQLDRPRALAAVESPPPGAQSLGIRADSLVQIRLSENGTPCARVQQFLAALGESNG
jgi:hypothetical protein